MKETIQKINKELATALIEREKIRTEKMATDRIKESMEEKVMNQRRENQLLYLRVKDKIERDRIAQGG